MTDPRRDADRMVLRCRAFVERDKGATGANLRDALRVLRPATGKAALEEARELLVRDLVFDGTLEPDGSRYLLAADDRERLRVELGLPATSVPTWAKLRDVWLLARALGLAPPSPQESERFAKAANCRAAVIAAAHRLELRDYPSSTEVFDTLTWNRLQDLTGTPITEWRQHSVGGGKLVAFLLLDPLGLRSPRTSAQMLSLLAKTAVDAVGDRLPVLRSAVLQRWRERGPLRSRRPPQGAAEEPQAEDTLGEFVAALGNIPRADLPTRRADGAIFVAELWQVLQRSDPRRAGDLPEFKQRLLAAARAGRLRLMRADLVEAMDPGLVERSEISDLHARFHLAVLTEAPR